MVRPTGVEPILSRIKSPLFYHLNYGRILPVFPSCQQLFIELSLQHRFSYVDLPLKVAEWRFIENVILFSQDLAQRVSY